jgi:hypothetical protein
MPVKCLTRERRITFVFQGGDLRGSGTPAAFTRRLSGSMTTLSATSGASVCRESLRRKIDQLSSGN